jgi:hypothetical protein
MAGRSCSDDHVLISQAELDQLRESVRRAERVTVDLLFAVRFENACARGLVREDERELWRGAVREHDQAALDALGQRYGAAA